MTFLLPRQSKFIVGMTCRAKLNAFVLCHAPLHTLVVFRSKSAMSFPRPSPRFCVAQSKVFAVVQVTYILTICPCFDNLKFDNFRCRWSSVPLYHVSALRAGRFPYMSTDTFVQNLLLDFYLCFIGTKLVYDITLAERLKVPNSRYQCS